MSKGMRLASTLGVKRRGQKPRCGLHPGLSFGEYLSLPYLSRSTIVPACKSAAHYVHELNQDDVLPEDEPEYLTIGSAIHTMTLEPERFDDRFVVEPDFVMQLPYHKRRPGASPRTTTEYKGRVARFRAANPRKRFLSEDAYQRVLAACKALRPHLPRDFEAELSVVWDCPETDLRLKGRIDILTRSTIWDIKTMEDASRFEFVFSRPPIRADVQGAIYQDLFAGIVGGRPRQFGILAVERVPPFGVRKGLIPTHVLEDARTDYCRALRRIRQGIDTGKWPGYEDQIYFRRPGDPSVDIRWTHNRIVTL